MCDFPFFVSGHVPHASSDTTLSKHYIGKVKRFKHLVIMYILYVLSDLMYIISRASKHIGLINCHC